jgi:hypothetical protein
MKKIIAAMSVLIALGVYVAVGGATGFAIGKSKLSAKTLDLDSESIVAKGNASMSMSPSAAPLEIGQMQLESMTAQAITIRLQAGKAKKLAMKDAEATGGVIIRAKRADKDTGADGKPVRVMRDVYASAQTATMPESQDVVKLSGDVVVKITDPGASEPIATVTGEIVMVSLKDGKIHIEGQGDNPAEFTVTPKEGEKK